MKLRLEDVFNLCPNLEELHWLDSPLPSDDAAPPISGAHLLRMRVLALRKHRSEPMNGTTLASLLLSAPLLEKIFLASVVFDAATVQSLKEAVRMRTALQRMRVVCLDDGRENQMLNSLLVRMRTGCPRFESGLVSPTLGCRDEFWQKHFCQDNFFTTNYT